MSATRTLILPVLFAILIIFAIVEGSISLWLTARYSERFNYPSIGIRDRTRFLVFTSWWTVLGSFLLVVVLLYSGTGYESHWTTIASSGIFLTITWIFWLSAAIAITVGLHGGADCSVVTHPIYCVQLNSLLVFAWICWAVITILLFAVIIRGIVSLRRGDGLKGQIVEL